MAKRDVATQYVGSLLGFVWTFVHPVVLILVLWVVFSLGFRVKPAAGVPFAIWLAAGASSWFLFADIIGGAVGIIVANGPVLKKTLFPSQILPVVRIVSCTVTHLIFIAVLIVLILFEKLPLSLWFMQVLYYYFCLAVLALGLSWALSSLNVFIRDVSQIVGVLLQLGFWATPIFWDMAMMPPRIQTILKLNPMYYVVQGYRDSVIYFVPFWRHPLQTFYFWSVTAVIFIIGALVFRKLKPHFADVL